MDYAIRGIMDGMHVNRRNVYIHILEMARRTIPRWNQLASKIYTAVYRAHSQTVGLANDCWELVAQCVMWSS